MLISRVSAGIMMIGASIFLFLIAGLTNDPEVAMGVEERTFAVNFFFLIAAVLVGVGIRLAFFGKSCPVCGEKLRHAATHRHHFDHDFDTAPRR